MAARMALVGAAYCAQQPPAAIATPPGIKRHACVVGRRRAARHPTAAAQAAPRHGEPAVVASSSGSSGCAAAVRVVRRALLSAAAAALVCTPLRPAAASLLPEALDRAWEGIGGGPADLVFPEDFLGVWEVDSVLISVQLPLGPEFVPDMRVVQRAQQEDLNAVVRYRVAFLRNGRGEIVPDRRFNTASLMEAYTGAAAAEVGRRIVWDPDNPNQLQMTLPGGLQVSTRVTRRSEELGPSPDRLSTSEYFQQLISTPQAAQPKVKASQCFTKYHWRSEAEAAAGQGVRVVATQVVSDYLTSFDDPGAMMAAGGKPVVSYQYRMAFRRASEAAAATAD